MKAPTSSLTPTLVRAVLVLILIALPISAAAPAAAAPAGSVFTVTSVDDADDGACTPSHCSLREAILSANASPGLDTITFNIPGAGAHTIQPSTELPELSDSVIIDGYTQPGASANTNPTNAGTNAQLRIQLDGADKKGVAGLKLNANDSVVRGLAISRFDGWGIHVGGSGNAVAGNFLGTDFTGTVHLPNGGRDLYIGGAYTLIGNSIPEARNVIADEVMIIGGLASFNQFVGNLVGIDATGLQALGVGGITLQEAPANIIGGSMPESRNVICGGIRLMLSADGNVVAGNYIGTLANGTTKCAGETGIRVETNANVIGGLIAGAGNVIAGQGIGIAISGNDNLVKGNYIGTDAAGTAALGNDVGVQITGRNNKIGGLSTVERNIISGNRNGVVLRDNAIFNRVFGNYIGLAVTGLAPLPNGGDAIVIINAARNAIGGPEAGAGNVIAHNTGSGVLVASTAAAFGNQIRGNLIYGNQGLGIDLSTASYPGPGDGITANDAGDADDGPNRLLNYPVLTSIRRTSETTVTGVLDSAPLSVFEVQFFANSPCGSHGFGEGQTLLASALVTTNAAGRVEFTQTFTQTLAPTAGIAAITSDAEGNTSEFSFCLVRNLYLPLALRGK